MKKHDPGSSASSPSPTSNHQNLTTQIVSTIRRIQLVFDEAKSARNARERDLPFTQVEHFDFETAHYEIDDRITYPELRIVALGLLRQRVHVLCFTPTAHGIRVISFRKANPREIRDYEKARSTDES
jgi:uncharacterized DUF497 family protein